MLGAAGDSPPTGRVRRLGRPQVANLVAVKAVGFDSPPFLCMLASEAIGEAFCSL